ncbi:MAG: hypothetical protein RBG13Loki_4313 [Promethearchaeota archaeon CR_4]|nr:MAG: hypothetical protein RBG13Loki_4313 [Candidatus Lokiarchaeota archaeon CR_4]
MHIGDTGGLLEAIAAFDKLFLTKYNEHLPLRRVFIEGRDARSVLHLVWDPRQNILYPNIGLDARGPQQEWLPLKENIDRSLPSNSSIMVTIDAGC